MTKIIELLLCVFTPIPYVSTISMCSEMYQISGNEIADQLLLKITNLSTKMVNPHNVFYLPYTISCSFKYRKHLKLSSRSLYFFPTDDLVCQQGVHIKVYFSTIHSLLCVSRSSYEVPTLSNAWFL